MPSPAKKAPHLGRERRRGAGDHVRLAQPQQGPDRGEDLLIGPAEGRGELGRRRPAVLGALHVPAADIHGLLHRGPPGRVGLGGQQGLDPGPDLLPDPRDAEEGGGLHLTHRLHQLLHVRAEIHVPGRADRQVDAEHALRDMSQRQVGDPAHVRPDVAAPQRRGHLVQDAVVGEQDALGVAGGPGGVEQGGRVLRGDRGQPLVSPAPGPRPAAPGRARRNRPRSGTAPPPGRRSRPGR